MRGGLSRPSFFFRLVYFISVRGLKSSEYPSRYFFLIADRCYIIRILPGFSSSV